MPLIKGAVNIKGAIDFESSPTFELPLRASGQRMLPQNLEINGVSVAPTFLYTADNAAATWTATVGTDFSTTGAGNNPAFDQGSPFGVGGGADTSVTLSASNKYFEQASGATYNVTTEDLVFEAIVRPTADGRLFFKGSTNRIQFYITSGRWGLYLQEGANTINILSDAASVAVGGWHHVMGFADKSSATGGRVYVNGAAPSTSYDCSGVGSLTSASDKMTISQLGASGFNGGVGLVAMWVRSAWLGATSEWDAIAKQRYSQLCGTYPKTFKGTATPTVATRASAAYLDKIEADGTTKLYYVGANHMRVCDRKDVNGTRVQGYLAEPAATQQFPYTEDLTNGAWWKSQTSVSANALIGPNGLATMDGIISSAVDGEHITRGLSINALTSAPWVLSGFSKAGNRDWVCCGTNISNTLAWFNIANGTVGTKQAAVTAANIEDWGNGIYRWWLTFTGTASQVYMYIYIAEDDNDNSFAGDNATINSYHGMLQLELGNYPTSYIPNTGATTVPRAADVLTYKADDGNVTNNQQGQMSCDILRATPGSDFPIFLTIQVAPDQTDQVVIAAYATSGNGLFALAFEGAPNEVLIAGAPVLDGAKHGLAMKWSPPIVAGHVDGALSGTDTVFAGIPVDKDVIEVGHNSVASQPKALVANVKIRDH